MGSLQAQVAGPSRTAYAGTLSKQTWAVLLRIWEQPLSLESNYARANRNEVASLASLGYVSVIAPDGLSFMREWHITAPGLMALKHHAAQQAAHSEQRKR